MLLELFGLKPRLNQHGYELFLTAAEHEWAERFLAERKLVGKKLLGVHIGSGGTKNLALRRWPLANLIALINRITRVRLDVNVLLFGGPEEERDHARVLAATDSARVFQPQTQNLCQAAALLKQCAAFLSVDTSLMHVAAAMRVPGQVVIKTPTWNKPIEPHGNPFRLVKNPVMAGRNLEFYRYDGHGIKGTNAEIARCMESVTVEAVFDAVLRALR